MSADQVPPPPDNPEPPSWVGDTLAKGEERNYPNEDALKGQRHKNDMVWLQVYGWVVVALMCFFAFLFIVSIFAWAYHYVMPVSYCWLNDEQLSKIQSVIFSGSLGGVVAAVAQRQLDKDSH